MIHFISDLHLSPESPGITRIFLDYLGGAARSAEQLFILGDLFEVWPGDDTLDDAGDGFSRLIADSLLALSRSGVELRLMHGNRDFLLGKAFAAHSGIQLLPDPYVLTRPEWQFVLSHGDLLCTDDREYQTFRTQVRSAAWQAAFLGKSLTERKAIANALRQQSERLKGEKLQHALSYQMDLNPAATDDFLRDHGYATFIHGHTHHPATHDHLVDGIHVERWVLADWHDERGEYLCWDGHRLHREALR